MARLRECQQLMSSAKCWYSHVLLVGTSIAVQETEIVCKLLPPDCESNLHSDSLSCFLLGVLLFVW